VEVPPLIEGEVEGELGLVPKPVVDAVVETGGATVETTTGREVRSIVLAT